jgi:hypothetical protein
VACYAEDPDSNAPPRELRWAFRSEKWGLPKAGGWLAQPAGLVDKMTTCLNAYNAIKAFNAAENAGEFASSNPGYWKIIQSIELRRLKRANRN